MASTDDEELEFLRRRADSVGLYINRHRNADVLGGDLYIQPKKKWRSDDKQPSLIKYATADEAWQFLTEYVASS